MYKSNNSDRSKRLMPAQRDEACSLYLSGKSTNKVGALLGVSGVAINNLLKKRGIPRRPPPTLPMHSDEEHKAISRMYTVDKKSTAHIARELDVDIGTIINVLRRSGVKQRSGSERNRKYTCNHQFFHTIDSETKAYWLGFIAADGYISKARGKTNSQLVVSLATVDRQHLVKLKDALQSTHPVREYDYSATSKTSRPYASFSIRSQVLAEALARFGIVPAKTHTLRWPGSLPKELLHHYLRGVFDGDGCWNISSTNVCFRLTSNRDFLVGCQNYLRKACNLPHTRFSERQDKWKGTVPTLIYGGRNQVSRIFHLMYDDATIYLPRKKVRVEPHII